MTGQERQRLGWALVASIAVHVVAFIVVEFGDWRSEPFPEFSGPLYVSVEPLEREPDDAEDAEAPQPEGLQSSAAEEQRQTEPEPEPERRPEPEPQPEPEPEPQPEPEPEPSEPAQDPADQETSAEQPQASSAQQSPQSAPPEQEAPASQAPQAPEEQQQTYEYSLEDLHSDGSPQTTPGARETAPEADEFQRLPSEGEAAGEQEELPDWATRPRETVEDAGFSTEDVSDDKVEELAEKVATDPEFQRSLSNVVSALENRSDGNDADASSRPGSGEEGNGDPATTDTTTDGTTGDSEIEWVGTGSRELLNAPAVPEGFFSASDFGGSVPAEASFVIVFEVDWRGNVVPGSVLFQQGGGFVQAQEKLRARVRSWRFEPAEGASDATGIFTLYVRRDHIR